MSQGSPLINCAVNFVVFLTNTLLYHIELSRIKNLCRNSAEQLFLNFKRKLQDTPKYG